FTGKEADVEVGLTYFGKRYLSTNLNRWTSADPLAVHESARADLNLYGYAQGQALKVVDPIGLDVVFAETVTAKERSTILADMQKLTRDKLELHKRDSGAFEVRIAARTARKAVGDKPSEHRNAGTTVIRALVDRTHTTRLDVYDLSQSNNTDPEGPEDRARTRDAHIKLNFKAAVPLFEQDPAFPNSRGRVADVKEHIGVAHELVHAFYITGSPPAQGDTTRKFIDEHGRLATETISLEEVRVTGLKEGYGTDTTGISENAIRREQQVPLRAAYVNPANRAAGQVKYDDDVDQKINQSTEK
ncbi:MAG: RHS repeat-associated core domain-containing protein, partial [Polyangiaceae bacterium]|nr:RHS repeat-associated core domain-containing protein [Polyangiaceae bacterium]